PVATVAIGSSGAKNAALLAVQMIATTDAALHEKLVAFRSKQTEKSLSATLPE
ncbi:MAG: AIR carboxylase family protein, partial [Bdellovibrionales bacterium]|nr:AIR carboxylase family protein [Bdellovibrionales bacterium]